MGSSTAEEGTPSITFMSDRSVTGWRCRCEGLKQIKRPGAKECGTTDSCSGPKELAQIVPQKNGGFRQCGRSKKTSYVIAGEGSKMLRSEELAVGRDHAP